MWAAGVTDTMRHGLEQRYSLSQGELLEGRTWAYLLTDPSPANIKTLVGDVAVADTAEIDRTRFRVSPRSSEGRYPSAPHPTISTILWALTWLSFSIGVVAIAAGIVERAAPRTAKRRVPRETDVVPLHRRQKGLVLLLLGVLLAVDVTSMRHMTLTYDEPEHFKYGENILLRHNPARLDDSSMPILALNALPAAVAMHMPPGPLSSFLDRPETGRYITVLFSLLVALCVFAWTRDLYGANAGLLALTLYTFDPNLLAHSQLITTDLYVAGAMAFTLYFFWKALHQGSWGLTITSGLMLGLAQISKYTAIALFPLLAVIAVVFYAKELSSDVRQRRFDAVRRRAIGFSGVALALMLLSLLVINVGFLFNRTLTPLNEYAFESNVFQALQSRSGVLGRLPLPVPHAYLQGLDEVIAHERTGEVFGRTYLLGRLREAEGFAGYYVYACLYKLPIATLFLLFATGVVYLARWRSFQFPKNGAMLLVPVLFFTIYFNFFYRAQIGIRHFLVVFPLLYVSSGALVAKAGALTRPVLIALSVAIAAMMLSVMSYYPHFLPYFNELVWDRNEAYTVLADSNIDWGQEEWYLRQYLAAHPDAVVDPDIPTAGTILVHVNALTGVLGDPERFRWLREHFKPVDHVAHAVLLYRVSAADLEQIRREP